MPALVPVAIILLLPRRPAQRVLDLLLLLLDQVCLHGVVVVVVLFQQHELPLLLEHRLVSPPRGLSLVPAAPLAHVRVVVPAARLGELLPPLQRLPVDAALVYVLVVPGLVPRVVNADHAAVYGGAAQVVHREVGAALVLVLEPAEAARLARLLVAGELEEGRLAVLREDGYDIALAELVGQPAEVDEGRVAVVDMPGGVGGAVCAPGVLACAGLEGLWSIFLGCRGNYAHSLLDLFLVEVLYRSYFVHGGWRRGRVPPRTRVEEVPRNGPVARLGEFWVTSVRLKAQKWRRFSAQGSPFAEQADLRFLLVHMHFTCILEKKTMIIPETIQLVRTLIPHSI